MHFHVVGRGNDINQVNDNVFFYPEDNNTFLTQVLYKLVEKELGEVWVQTLTKAERSIRTSTST